MNIAASRLAAVLIVAAAPAAPAADKAAPLLTSTDLDPVLVLPMPPAAGSAQAKAELAELHAVEATRTPMEEADARADGDAKSGAIFAEAIGPRFDLAHLPATARLLDAVRAAEKETVERGKDEFKRARPYVVDPTLRSCKRNDDPLSSYPSGHTAMAFAMGETLAALLPDHAPAVLARAARYGQSRIVCGQHYRSDVTAGEVLGVLIAERLAEKPAFRSLEGNARQELARLSLPQPTHSHLHHQSSQPNP